MQSKNFGTFLLVVGILMIVYTGFSYITTEKVIDIGPLEVNADKKHNVSWSPIIGSLILGLAVIILLFKNKKLN